MYLSLAAISDKTEKKVTTHNGNLYWTFLVFQRTASTFRQSLWRAKIKTLNTRTHIYTNRHGRIAEQASFISSVHNSARVSVIHLQNVSERDAKRLQTDAERLQTDAKWLQRGTKWAQIDKKWLQRDKMTTNREEMTMNRHKMTSERQNKFKEIENYA